MTPQLGVVVCLALLGLTSALICPDGGMCDDGNTCCKTSSGGYGCCPLPNAECCEDHLHCCYEGTVCDLAHSKCLNKTVSLPWVKRVPAKQSAVPQVAEGLQAVLCPDGESECPDDTTCCPLTEGSWGCCPLAKAVCCEDKTHCCPEGTKCDVTHSKCLSSLGSSPMLDKLPARRREARENLPAAAGGVSVSCPGGKSQCPEGTSCCLMKSGEYGCCPYPEAVCCSDQLSCCPHNTTCDLKEDMCINSTTQTPLGRKFPSTPNHAGTQTPLVRKFLSIPNDAAAGGVSVSCPGGKSQCPEGTSCCLMKDREYGCCPYPEAVCCSDQLSCCPHNTTCDLKEDMCISSTTQTPLGRKFPSTPNHAGTQTPLVRKFLSIPNDVSCPGGKSQCPEGTSCCLMKDGEYGCCPYPEAVCCSDQLSCCPHNTTCDLKEDMCISSTTQTPLGRKFPSTPNHAGTQTPLVRKFLSIPNNAAAGGVSVSCPGGKSQCPEGTSCCLMKSGEYGCCPYPEAVCCSDQLSCCPHNTTCDLKEDMCISSTTQTPLGRKFPSTPNHAGTQTPLVKMFPSVHNDVVCPDELSMCPDSTTCCQLGNGTYGCCPMPKAVCCSDHLHCCPEATTCDLAHSTCVSALGQTSTPTKISKATVTTSLQSRVKAVPCNDTVACAQGSTCCKTLQGEWACCPLPKAVCCDDHLHCCPHNTVCNLAASTCDDPSGSALMPWLEKLPAFSWVSPRPNSQCDGSTSCPGDATCCKTPDGDWACCPMPKAVCCDDHTHCCPQGTVCNLEASTCDDPLGSVPWVVKVPALTQVLDNDKCDEQTMCPGGSTCCRQNSGDWACCPLPHAVCCDDHEHCCPKGYTCDVTQQTCDKPGALSLPWVRKIPALRSLPARPVTASARPAKKKMCDPHTSCPKDTTCCFMNKAGKWGCCPLPQAVCCADGDHCCPSGYICNTLKTSCTKGRLAIPWYRKEQALVQGSPAVADTKCDDQSSCASGATCCKLATGEWGCCPLVKAVCCTDHEHCCPQAYNCNMETGTCEKKAGQPLLPAVPLTLAEPQQSAAAETGGDVQCDSTGEFRCPNQETCCKTSDTQWACCPFAKAVCCTDSKHCCPLGYVCDLAAGGCTKQYELTWDTFLHGQKART